MDKSKKKKKIQKTGGTNYFCKQTFNTVDLLKITQK